VEVGGCRRCDCGAWVFGVAAGPYCIGAVVDAIVVPEDRLAVAQDAEV
jgi:hypothetical protein